jgi:hypothetical protein
MQIQDIFDGNSNWLHFDTLSDLKMNSSFSKAEKKSYKGALKLEMPKLTKMS